LQTWLSAHGAPFEALVEQVEALSPGPGTGLDALLGGRRAERRYRRAWRDAIAQLPAGQREYASKLSSLLNARRTLLRQAAALAHGRRLMAWWHAMHVPLAVALFFSAIVHIVAALYFS
jgi:hypothetical protein